MPMKHLLLASALLAAAPFAPAAKAATVSSVSGDLILGFYATSGAGSGSNLEVDLGPASNFANLAAGTVLTLPGLAAADLSATYGSNWSSDSALFWGLAGTSGGIAPTLWASNAETVPGTQSAPWTPASSASQRTGSGAIGSLYTTLNGATSTSNSGAAAVISAAIPGSYETQDLVQAGESFKFFNPSVDGVATAFGTQGSALDHTAYAVLDVYKLVPNTGASTLLGGLGLNAAGNLVFSNDISKFGAVVPEPSTYGMLAAGAALLLLAARRKPLAPLA